MIIENLMLDLWANGAALSMLTVCRCMRRKSARADSGDSSLPACCRRWRMTRYRIRAMKQMLAWALIRSGSRWYTGAISIGLQHPKSRWVAPAYHR